MYYKIFLYITKENEQKKDFVKYYKKFLKPVKIFLYNY